MTERVTMQAAIGQGDAFVSALARKSADGLRDAFSASVRFRGLTPGRAWEADNREDAVNILLGCWFEPTDHIDELVSHDVHAVADRVAIRYCLKVRNDEGLFLVEQQGYLILADDGRIADAAIVCSG